MRSVAGLKSAAVAPGMSTKVWRFRSTRGNQVLWIWTMMRWPEGVVDLNQREVDGLGLVRGEGLGLAEAMTKFAAHGLTADELLVAGEKG